MRRDYEFKENVRKIYYEKCIISGADMDECSICHIKPFCDSDDNEKYDYNNGIILSDSFHKLYDKYYFTIHPETFEIIILESVKYKNLCINKYENNVININYTSKKYLEHHYKIFCKEI